MRWNQDTAKRATRVAQIGAIAAALVVAMVFFLPAPDLAPPPPDPAPTETAAAEQDSAPKWHETREDWTIVAASLEAARFADPTPGDGEDGEADDAAGGDDGDTPEDAAEQTEPQPADAPGPAPPGFRYIGFGAGPGGPVALMQMAQLQRFVRVGDTAGNYEITEITPQRVIASARGRDYSIPREEPAPIDFQAGATSDEATSARERRQRELERLQDLREQRRRNQPRGGDEGR